MQGSKAKAGAAKPLQSSSVFNANNGKTIEETYQKKTQLEHILLRPDTYVGSIEKHVQLLWIYEDDQMVQRPVSYVPGLYKIFDEILVNASDNKQRDPSMDSLKVDIDVEKNTISVFNNGDGVPVEIHAEEQVYVPEMIFGHLLTSSNYDDSEKKTTGGRNGYGAKLANIFSTEFVIETADGKRLRKYKQVFRDNMSIKSEPEITKCKANENWTKVTFQPDLVKFNMTILENDVVALMCKRVLDVAGFLGKSCKVELNGKRLPIKSFADYVGLYLSSPSVPSTESGEPLPKIYERVNERWEVCVTMSDGQFQQVSFVNGIATIKGGTHVNSVVEQITSHVMAIVNKKDKNSGVKAFQLRNHMWIFVNALIDNPAFDSQTKETLTTRQSSFGSKCELSPEFLKKVAKCGIVESILSWADQRKKKELKKTDGSKRERITGITKLDDANDAGGSRSQECTLILTEGDSAKALAMSGISVVGRNKYGCFPLRGKLLNVREANHQQVMDNAEINNIKRILGLQHGKDYDSTKTLRYGHLMIMTDQDHDGSHIKGLLINFIHSFWPSLLKIPSFLVEFITPIVKATHKNGTVISFYSMPEYETWKGSLQGETKSWSIKYYKGLGTSSAKEGKEYFRDLVKHKKDFMWEGERDGDAIEMAFSKKKVDARKVWLRHYEPGTFLDQTAHSINYTDFVNKELIQFSIADLTRSIPSMVDGLKPGQRKILFCCFKRNFVKQAKVIQFSGYVSEHSAYHHGDQNLATTIIAMAQNYVGSNNINLLAPLGQFGTRSQGGKDHASSRYIFTCLAPITRFVFPQADDVLLDYQKEDGQGIEPTWYAPIIPLVLVNGSEGIGTGWSTFIPNYNPRDVVDNVKRLLQEQPMKPMDPWYKGFKGTIERSATKETGVSYTVTGIIEQINETTLRVTELPVRKWTQDYKEFLETLILGTAKVKEPFIKDYREHNTDTLVDFEIQLSEENMTVALSEGLTKKFKLTTTISTSNMHLFDAKGIITKYDTPEQIIKEFFDLRLELYVKRKAVQMANLELELLKVSNKVRFILGVIKGEIVVSNRKRAVLLAELKAKNFTPFPKSAKKNEPPVAGGEILDEEDGADEGRDEVVRAADGVVRAADYDYLLSMAIGTLTVEKVEQLLAQQQKMQQDVEELRSASPKTLWERDLDKFLEQLDAQEAQEAEDEEYELKHRSKEGSQNSKRAAKRTVKTEPKVKKADQIPQAALGVVQPVKAVLKKKSADGTAPGRAKAGANKKAASPKIPVEHDEDREDAMAMGLDLNLSLSDRLARSTISTGAQTNEPNDATILLSEDEERLQPEKSSKGTRKTKKVVLSDSEEEFPSKAAKPKAGAGKKAAETKKRGSKQSAGKSLEEDVAIVVEEISHFSPYKKSPEKKVRRIRISPFHKKSGPAKTVEPVAKFPSLEAVAEPVKPQAASSRPRRAIKAPVQYVHQLSDDDTDDEQSEEEVSDFENEDDY